MKQEGDMKIRSLTTGITILVTLCSLSLIIPSVSANVPDHSVPGTPTAPARFQTDELRQIVAPIALYPDPLLAQIFMASTYPVDVVLASRWLKGNEGLKGDALDSALKDKEWDVSVKSLVHFPEVLFLLNDNLEWTNKLGYAFLNQRKEVMDAAQYLRQRAKEEGNLNSTPEQNVLVDDQGIRIEPASPTVVYVPAYNPAVVYGSWYYPATPWFVYPVSPWYYPVPYGFWWCYPSWVYCNVYVYDDDCHDCDDDHDDHDDHDGDHHHDGDKNKNDNHGKGYKDGKGNGKGGWKEWQHDSTRGRFFASRDRSTIQRTNQSLMRSRDGGGNLQGYRQNAPDRQRQAAFQTRSRESMVNTWEGRRDNRSYNLRNSSGQNQGRVQTGVVERVNAFRANSGSGLVRTQMPRIQQINTGGSSFQRGSLGNFGSSIGSGFGGGMGGNFGGRVGGGFGGNIGGGGFGGGGFRGR